MTVEKLIDLRKLVFDRLSEYDILRYYLQADLKLNTSMKSPFHRDKNPSFSVGVTKGGHLQWNDYSADERGGCTDLVMKLYGLHDYYQALEKIAKDFQLLQGDNEYKRITSQYVKPVIDPARNCIIHVTTKEFTADDLKWWGQYLITADDLRVEEIYRVKEFYVNRQRQKLDKHEKCYAYYYAGKGFKIYMPERSKEQGRWKSSISCSHVEGLEKLNKDPRVLITKSKKDKITLQKIVPYPVLNVQNEGISGYTEEFRELLKGRRVIISYDSDPVGVKNCKRICDTWNYNYVNTPRWLLDIGIKDWSDWIKYTNSLREPEDFLKSKNII